MMSAKKRNASFPGWQRSVASQYMCIYKDLQANSIQDVNDRLNYAQI